MKKPHYLRFDEIEDVLSSLDLLALVAPHLRKQPGHWKWMIVASHGALQGAMVCALRDSSVVSVLTKECAKKMLDWYDSREGERPEERLADFNTLLKRTLDSQRMDGEPLKLTRHQAKDIDRLHKEFRNGFAHFIPQSWSIETAGLPRIVCAAIDAVESLMGHSRVVRQLTGNRKRRLAQRLKSIRGALT